MSLLEILIPVYEMQNKGLEMLSHSFKQLKVQKFKDFSVLISDDSQDEKIKTYVGGIKDLNIKYIKNEGVHSIAGNMNNAIKNATGEIIQVMCQDDYFYNKDSLQNIVDNFDRNKGWMCSMYMHTKDRFELFKQQIPMWNSQICLNNTLGTPSCLSFLNNDVPLLDENLKWYVDCEHYYRLFKKWGIPKILKELVFVQLLWEGQTTQGITQEIVDTEIAYIKDKYIGEIS